jgi:hypothetical protein
MQGKPAKHRTLSGFAPKAVSVVETTDLSKIATVGRCQAAQKKKCRLINAQAAVFRPDAAIEHAPAECKPDSERQGGYDEGRNP